MDSTRDPEDILREIALIERGELCGIRRANGHRDRICEAVANRRRAGRRIP